MKNEYFLIGTVFSIVLVATWHKNHSGTNLTDSASNAVGNARASVNQTASELGHNASNTGETLLNQTGEVAKKIIGGAATVLGNTSGEIKEGTGAKEDVS